MEAFAAIVQTALTLGVYKDLSPREFRDEVVALYEALVKVELDALRESN